MAEITTSMESNLSRNRWRKSLKIDMTPMVDLGFLLITFFIFTTSMTVAAKLNLYMPTDGVKSVIGDSSVITILLDDEETLYYYEGAWNKAVDQNKVITTGYSTMHGIGKLIRAKQARMGTKRNELILLIKPSESSTYKNLVNALDEILIHDLKKYALIDLTIEEKEFITKQKQNL